MSISQVLVEEADYTDHFNWKYLIFNITMASIGVRVPKRPEKNMEYRGYHLGAS